MENLSLNYIARRLPLMFSDERVAKKNIQQVLSSVTLASLPVELKDDL